MKNRKRIMGLSYRHHYLFVGIAYFALIVCACLTIGANTALLREAHQSVNFKTDHYISDLSQSISNALQERFERTWMLLESVAFSCDSETVLSADELAGLQKRAELLQFEYFAFISPDGSAICTDGSSRTFARQDGIMKAFEGQPVIDLKTPGAEVDVHNKKTPLFAVPIYSHNGTWEITGVLAAPVSPKRTDFFLTQSYYGGDVFFNIIQSDGTEVFVTKRAYIPQFDEQQDLSGTNNLFDALDANVEMTGDTDVEDLREAAAAGRDETIRFRLPHEHLIQAAQLTPVGDTDLCIWMVDTSDAVSGGLDQVLHKAFWLDGFGTLCLAMLIIALLFLYRKIMHTLMVDSVTGGYSLSRFNQEAEYLIHHAKPGEYTFMVINVVGFKIFNDIYGHDESNRILKYLHDTMLKYMECGEILTRSNVDFFNILIRSTREEEIRQKLDSIVVEINRFNDERTEKQWIMLEAGVYQIMDVGLPMILIRDRANIARKKLNITTGDSLYSCGFYKEEDRTRLQQENIIKNKMDDALERHDFHIYLQPKADVSNSKIVAAEALVRWKDAEMGLVAPDEFIPLFERIGFIQRLDLYMFEQACLCLRRWLDAGVQPVPISVNLSRMHLNNKNFLAPFVEVQKKYCIPPELLELELTETAVQDYPDAIPEAIGQIHLAGYTCSLDDFGSGYSSLNNLEALDIDVLKLDRKFLRDACTENDKGHIVIEELIHMARRLGIKVCCEGVETETQLAFLEKCHCDLGQGYLFSKPVEAAAFEKLLYGASL